MDYAQIEAFLIGDCGKTLQQAMLTSYGEYLCLVKAHQRRYTEEWERVRWLAWYTEMLSPHIKPGNKHKSPKDLFLLPGEMEEQTKKVTPTGKLNEAELEALSRIFKTHYKINC